MPSNVRGTLDRPAGSQRRSAQHVLIGLGVTAAAIAAAAAAARLNAPASDNPQRQSPVVSLAWPPLFLALTLSGLRIWNAPKSPQRTQALTLWGVVQALNAMWMALGPRRLGGRLTAAVTALGTAWAYVWRARKVDAPAAGMVAPYVGLIGVANVLTEELWRKSPPGPTIH